MPKEVKPSWQKILKCRIRELENENFKLVQQVAFLKAENTTLHRLVAGPPTIMIACEKIVESAAQVATASVDLAKETKYAKR